MRNRHYTIMVVPSATSRIKKVKISARLLHTAVLGTLVAFCLAGWFGYDYLRVKGEVVELDALRTEAREQRLKLNSFAQQVIDVEKEMGRLRKFDSMLRGIFDLDQVENRYSRTNMQGIGGAERLELSEYPELLEGKINELTERVEQNLDQLKMESRDEEASLNELVGFLQERRSLLMATPSVWPVRGMLTSSFRGRVNPFTGRNERHNAIDIATKEGTPIIAPADGVVTYVGRKVASGKVLVVDHGFGYTTKYAHNQKIDVQVGQRVKRGDVISFVGNTGRSTGPHLHYEIHKNGVPVNPVEYILN